MDNLTIINVSIRYEKGKMQSVQVQYDFSDDSSREYSINGFVTLSSEEYEKNQDIELLKPLVRQKVKNIADV